MSDIHYKTYVVLRYIEIYKCNLFLFLYYLFMCIRLIYTYVYTYALAYIYIRRLLLKNRYYLRNRWLFVYIHLIFLLILENKQTHKITKRQFPITKYKKYFDENKLILSKCVEVIHYPRNIQHKNVYNE